MNGIDIIRINVFWIGVHVNESLDIERLGVVGIVRLWIERFWIERFGIERFGI